MVLVNAIQKHSKQSPFAFILIGLDYGPPSVELLAQLALRRRNRTILYKEEILSCFRSAAHIDKFC